MVSTISTEIKRKEGREEDRKMQTFSRQGDKDRQTNRDRDSCVQTEKCIVGHVATEECLNTAAVFMDL